MKIIIKELNVLSRGRKLFDCTMGKYPAKLIINDVSKDLQVGDTVLLHVDDESTRSHYGTSLRFKPIGLVDADRIGEYTVAFRDRVNAERWLRLAEIDAERGLIYSNAIHGIRWTCRKQEHLLERVGMLEERVVANKLAKKAREQEQRPKRHEETRSLFRSRSRFRASGHPPWAVRPPSSRSASDSTPLDGDKHDDVVN